MFLLSLGEQGVCGLQLHCWPDSGQLTSMSKKKKKETKENKRPPLKVVAFPSVSVSTALFTSASVVLDLSFEACLGFHFISVHKQCKKKKVSFAAFVSVLSKCARQTNAALRPAVLRRESLEASKQSLGHFEMTLRQRWV